MTTTVTVTACCDDDQEEVRIVISNSDTPDDTNEEFTLKNGESGDYYVYDGREISIKEVEI